MLVSRNFSGGSLLLAHDQVGCTSHGPCCCIPVIVGKIEDVFSASCTIRGSERSGKTENIGALKSDELLFLTPHFCRGRMNYLTIFDLAVKEFIN